MANKQPPASKSITDCFSALPQPSGSGINNLQNQPSKKRQREDLENTPDIPLYFFPLLTGTAYSPMTHLIKTRSKQATGTAYFPMTHLIKTQSKQATTWRKQQYTLIVFMIRKHDMSLI